MRNEFKNPTNQYRPIPFWSWNDQLEKEELEYQIEEMKKAGVGGYFMHARSGLKVNYLSEEWFDCISTGIEKAKEVGLDAWAYDEEGWPSGFAGGRVPAISKDYQAKFMTLEAYPPQEEIVGEEIIALYKYCSESQTYEKMELDKKEKDLDKENIFLIRKHINPFYIDTMNKKAIDAFLACTHDIYYERFGSEFGSYMKGFFTDEPRFACNNFGELPWSDDLPSMFQEMHGYDLIEIIPSLFENVKNYEQHRYNYWITVNRMFVQNYMKTIYDWCETHNCKSTGHIMMEESIFSQMTSSGGVMPFYEYLHIPGIDWLRRSISSPVIGKQVGSVACQLGKKQVLTESFALCGWDVSFEELKWIAEWQFVNGVNQLCQHLQGYTIKGVRKRDYPPSLFTQQTWWNEYKHFNDYMSRLCVALSWGTQVADVLLIHPMRSGFVTYDGTRTAEIRQLDEDFTGVAEQLSAEHISYHFGDETIIEKYARVEDQRFVVGEVAYKTVVLPSMYTIDKVTLRLLIEFNKNGGTIFSIGFFPRFTNGNREELEALKQLVLQVSSFNLREQMQALHLVSLSISQRGSEIPDISYQQRQTEEGCLVFIVNHSQKNSYLANISVNKKWGKVTRFVAETGNEEIIVSEHTEKNTKFNLSFEPMQSYIVHMEQPMFQKSSDELGIFEKEEETQIIVPRKEWEIDKMDLNSMTLDTCCYRIDNGELFGPIPVIKLQSLLLELQHQCEVELQFSFQIDMDLQQNKDFFVVIEDANVYQIIVNKESVSNNPQGWWKDKSFQKIDIKGKIKDGENEIVLKTNFKQPQKVYDVLFGDKVYETEKNKITYDIELESIYLLGDFGVKSISSYENGKRRGMVTKGPFKIINKPTNLVGSNFTEQGFLFFAGMIEISQTVEVIKKENEKVLLKYGKHDAPFCKIYLNNQLVKDSLWAPYEVDVTEIAKNGRNKITYQLYASNRNLLGPHHHIDGECYNVGPESFTGKWSWVERTSEADATEVLDREKDYWADTYCFVKWGLHIENQSKGNC